MIIRPYIYVLGTSLLCGFGIYALFVGNQLEKLDFNAQPIPLATSLEKQSALKKGPDFSVIPCEIPSDEPNLQKSAHETKLPRPKKCALNTKEVKKYNHDEYTLGFKSTQIQKNPIDLTITGKIPEWLDGTFLAIGPGQFQAKGKCAEYWFDGFGMVHQFILHPKKCTYRNMVIESEYHKRTCDTGIFGSKPTEKKSTWAKLKGAMSSKNERPKYDNANINLISFNNKVIACTETPHAWCIDPQTLKTHACIYKDCLEGHFSTAHPLYDAQTKEWFNILITFAHNSTYTIYTMHPESFERIPLITLPAPYPSYIHSFALTKDYVLLIEVPFTVSPYDLLLSDSGFIDNFKWSPKNGTRILVVSRASKKLVGTYKTNAFFALHHLNAYQENDTIILDTVIYKDPAVIKSFYLDPICNDPKHTFNQAQLVRITINPNKKNVIKKELSQSNIEFPQINKEYALKAHQFVYGITSQNNRVTCDGIIKIDTKKGTEVIWRESSCFPCEPLFVSCPNPKSEDDGILLSLVLDGAKRQSFIVILNAKDLSQLGRVYVPYPIAYTVHSLFLKGNHTAIQNTQNPPHKKRHLFPPYRQK